LISFLTHLEPASPTLIEARNPESACSPVLLPEVGKVLPHKLTDGEREAAIGLAASLVEYHVELYEISGCFTDRANADRARLAMEALIKGRSAEQIARMEQERGLCGR
jgi:hypothetical protein